MAFRLFCLLPRAAVHGQVGDELGTLPTFTHYVQRALVIIDDPQAYRQAKTGAFANFLRREKGVHDFPLKGRRDAGAVVGDTYFNNVTLKPSGNYQVPWSFNF